MQPKAANFFAKVDTKLSRFAKWTNGPNIWRGVKIMAPVTPGRQQYYDGEQEIFLPDKIRYKINRPKHWAQSVDSQLYTRDVEQALLNYCRVELKHNVLDPERGFDLDLTLKELNLISQATDETIQAAESGQLAEMYAAYDAANDHLEQIKDIVYRDLSKLLQGVEDW